MVDNIERFYDPKPRQSTLAYLSPTELENKVALAWLGVRKTGSGHLTLEPVLRAGVERDRRFLGCSQQIDVALQTGGMRKRAQGWCM
ncbi:hypothetical protein FE840_019865 (plasmid) [Peteryoungia desertarenae]|uniref:Uncharacterized protein n=1 Tax=Peteryoungia desertarenae TaxID=1813451 RepID=A0ABX6QTN6_9HYPH|nr:hypothetical protein FE840_019865 [Peteryoungia desertarenae]